MTQKKDLEEIVGGENVVDDLEELEKYSGDKSFSPPGKPWCVVKPKNVEEVQQIVFWAKKNLTPLIPVSSPDGPRFHGDTVPRSGGVILDLSSMNNVLMVDRRNKVVHFQPGVTFGQLQSALKESGLKPLMPLMPRYSKSVLASYLEKNPLTIPRLHWDTIDPLVTLEIVYGTGDIMRSGSAAGPKPIKELINEGVGMVNPMGPGPSDYNRIVQGAQGTMGIVTWAACNCCFMPTIQHPYFIASEKMENLTTFIYTVLGKRLGEELFMVNNFLLANMMANLSDSIKSVCADLPPWIVFLNIAGFERRPEERVDYQEKDIREIAQQNGVIVSESVGGMSSSQFLNMINEPQPNGYWKLKYKGNCQDLFFLTTLERVQEFIDQAYSTARSHGYPSHEIGIYVQPIVQGTSCHCEFSFMYDPENARERENVEKLYLDLAKSLADLGAFYGRPYGVLSDIAYRRDAETTAVLRKIKAVFDPENILNPGKLCY